MFFQLLLNQLGGIVTATVTLNSLSDSENLPPILKFIGPNIELNTDYRLTPAPRFVVKFKRFQPYLKLTQVYLLHLPTNKTLTINL